MNIFVITTMADQGINSAFQQALTDEAVETTDYDAECKTLGIQFPFVKMRHDEPPEICPDPENGKITLIK
jgi:hypothetical protein